MLRRLSSVMSTLAISSVAMTVAFVGTLEKSAADTNWQQTRAFESSSEVKSIARGKKKKKSKKRVASKVPGGRSLASTGAHGRLLAQDDLDADLESELENDLGDANESATAQAPAGEPSVAAAEPTVAGEDVQIRDIQYDSRKDGGTAVILTTGAATYRTREIPSQNQVVVEIANAKLPERLKRPFNTKDFKQPIVSINAYQDAGSNTARIVFQFRQPRSIDVRQNGTKLTVAPLSPGTSSVAANQPSSPAPNSEAGPARASRSDDFGDDDAMAEEMASEENYAETSSGGVANSAPVRANTVSRGGDANRLLPSSSLEQERVGDVRFHGKPISLEVRETPIRDVISLIADQSGANIVLADDVTGAITIKLRQIPWDQALAIIMKTKNLGYVRQGSVLRIATIRQLQTEAEDARKIIEAQEATMPLRVKVLPVSFAKVDDLARQIKETLQSTGAAGGTGTAASRGKVQPDTRSSSLIVTDTDENIARIEQLVKALDTPPLQVMIEGKIVEAQEILARELGINWGYSGQDLGFAGGTLSHTAKIAPVITSTNTTLDLKLGTLDFFGDLNAKLQLYERESVIKIISSPRVVTMNAQTAKIEQSTQIPIPSTTIAATNNAPQTTEIKYKPIPTSLEVKPQITSGGDISMEITFKREFQSGTGGKDVPIETRSVQTNAMVKNGQTAVIGGMYQSDQIETEQGTPYLRKIPVLGWLFKAKVANSQRNELLVFITPRILNADRTLPKAGTIQ